MSTTATALSARASDRIVAHYAGLSRGDKVRFRNAMRDAAMAAVMAQNMDRATRYGAALAAVESARPSTATGPDYVTIVSDLAATLELAASLLRSGVRVGDADSGPIVRATEPGTPDAKRVADLTTVRTRAARSANGTVASWIAAHVTDVPMTIAQLRATADVSAYMPSTGAIGACLVRVANGDEDVDGFAVVDVDGRRGAVAI